MEMFLGICDEVNGKGDEGTKTSAKGSSPSRATCERALPHTSTAGPHISTAALFYLNGILDARGRLRPQHPRRRVLFLSHLRLSWDRVWQTLRPRPHLR